MSTVIVTLCMLIATSASIFFFLKPTRYASRGKASSLDGRAKCSVQVVVLGDVGRSPRMQYHALSIARHGGIVDLVGYFDSELLPELRDHPNVIRNALASSPTFLQTRNRGFFLLTAPIKVLLQVGSLWTALAYRRQPAEWMLVQNPPSIPVLLIAIVICSLRNTKLVIDWHNFGYSILATKLGHDHPLVKISQVYEKVLARFAYQNFAVTDAMCAVLKRDFAIPVASVRALHDRPAPIFQPLSTEARDVFLKSSPITSSSAVDIIDGRLKLIVSSTSWTPDEDFSLFIDALCSYSASATSDSPQLPELLVVITGKGPLRPHYQRQIESLERNQKLEMVKVKTAWLSFEHYASLLGSAQLGVSLHTSSSGVDLPMKVVDMFGTGLPVLGYNNFVAWSELVQEDVNGKGFATSTQMAEIMKSLFNPANDDLIRLRAGAMKESERRWDSEWDPVAGRIFGLVH